MTVIATALKHMLAAGMDPAAIVAAVAEMEREMAPAADRAAEKRREWDRERKRKQRNSALSGGSPVETGGNQVDAETLSAPEVSPHTPLPNPSNPIPPSPPKGGSSPTAVDQAVTAFSEMARQSGLSVPRAVTASRRRSLLLRIEEHGLAAVLDAIDRIGRSRFCRGENDRGWRADLDFLCQPKSFVSILEGKYDDRPLQQSQSPPRPQSPSMQRHHDIHARLKRELYGEPDEQFAGQTVDLAAGDFRSH
ncbi:DNA replication protein [Sinorhizobium meliloti]|uniref:DNA replication protein n=1 Tax=Rhizobium meliloti TaxID=382 RepID=UPI0012958C1F|nr:DNA replication protein [Sinorhizobium meliloti]MDW9568083.1 DNA replication protein [Sinorhizobium meliloti]MQV24219.1 DNA replication protein [Sinorhizobium meliloti]